MYYSDETIEEVRSRNDIVDIIGSYVSLKHRGNSYTACCPFHHEKTPSFHVNREKQMYHCFGCGVGGNVFTFVMEYENFSFPEAVRMLAERSGISLPEENYSDKQRGIDNYKNSLKEVNKAAAAYFHYLLTKTEHGKKGLEYLANRKLTEDTIKKFAMGYSDIYENDLYKYLKGKGFTDSQIKDAGLIDINEKKGATDKFWNRIMVPILDINGKVIGFGGRVLGDGLPKYVNTRETSIFDKGRTLFAMNLARRSKRRGIIICEGYMDVIAMHQAGFDNAVASLGTAFTIGQASLIKRYTDEVYLAYDSDEAGTKATLKNIGILREVELTTRVIDLRPYKDPDEFIKGLGASEFENRIKSAVTGIAFEIDTISARFDLNDPEDKTKFAKEAAKIISSIEEVVTRHSYVDTICAKYMFDKDGFKDMVTKYGTMSMDSKVVVDSTPVTNKKRDPDEEQKKPQRLILTWMVNDISLFDRLRDIITEDDFMDDDYRLVAHTLFEQYEKNHTVNPAAIVDASYDVDKQRLFATILQTELPFDTTDEEKEIAINDIIKKIKLQRIESELSNCGSDMVKFQNLIKQRVKIEKMHISLQ